MQFGYFWANCKHKWTKRRAWDFHKLLTFKKYQLDVKDIKCPLQWWWKHEAMFPTWSSSNFECCWISNWNRKNFSLPKILINLRRCLQIENFKKLIFVNKNSPNDPRIGCKSPSNLLKFFERDVDLKRRVWKVLRWIWKGWSCWSVKV